jgi:hypothetical protein
MDTSIAVRREIGLWACQSGRSSFVTPNWRATPCRHTLSHAGDKEHAVSKPHIGPPPAGDLFGYAVHHAVRARVCIERNRLWQAEYWISSLRDNALSLACRRLGLSAYYGRGFDELPEELLRHAERALVLSLDSRELSRALMCAVELLVSQSLEAGDLPSQVELPLRQFVGLP